MRPLRRPCLGAARANGGNPDPTRTHGKDAGCAKAIEFEGWDYPRQLEGAENVRRSVPDWLRFMHLESAVPTTEPDRRSMAMRRCTSRSGTPPAPGLSPCWRGVPARTSPPTRA